MASAFKMPKGKWKTVEFSDIDFADSNLGFLGNFEEFIPGEDFEVPSQGEQSAEAEQSIEKKGKKKGKKVSFDEHEPSESTESTPVVQNKKKNKKQQQKNKKDIEVSEASTSEGFTLPDDKQTSSETEKPKKKKKFTKKQKEAAKRKLEQEKPSGADSSLVNDNKTGEPPAKKSKAQKKKEKKAAAKSVGGRVISLSGQEITSMNDAQPEGIIANENKKSKKGEKAQKKIEKEQKKKKEVEKNKEQESEVEEEENEDEAEDDSEELADDDSEKDVEEAKPQLDMSAWAPFFLPEPLIKALNDMGFATPTDIQSQILPSAIRDRLDILGAAETGSGKTLAFAIPAICRIIEAEGNEGCGPRVIIIAPTRELVVQVKKNVDALLKYTKFRAVSIVGGLAPQKQARILRYKPEVIVATPGRLWDLMEGSESSAYLSDMSGLRALVIDETDRMIEKGHFEELELILTHIRRFAEDKLQTLVFSATLTYTHPAPKWMNEHTAVQLTPQEKLKRLIDLTGLRKQRKVVDITREFGTAEKLVETRMNCENLLQKDLSVVYLLMRYPGRTLIFLNSVDAARRLYGILIKLKLDPSPMLLHARMAQRQRLKNLERFAEQKVATLLATDVAARGLDIKGIEHVIHYQVPKTAELYIHRSGRTARASQTGLTVLLVDTQDSGFYRRICRNLNREKDLPIFPVDSPDLFSALKPRVKCAAEMDGLEHRAKKISARESWFVQAAKDADLMLDERDREKDQADYEVTSLRRDSKRKEMELRGLLDMDLPRFDRESMPKTRYITPEISALYDVQKTQDALEAYTSQIEEQQRLKKRSRQILTTRMLKMRKKDTKKGKKK